MLTATCPNRDCQLPDQHIGMLCGFCGTMIPAPAGAVAADGTAADVEEVIGWRGWKITYAADGTPRLNSPLFPLVWEPGEWMVATCRKNRTDDVNDPYYHGPDAPDRANWSPVKECGGTGQHGCGFYAARTRDHLVGHLGYAHYTENDPSVMGEVQMQGKVFRATNGWRAQQVRPVRLYVPYEFWKLANGLKEVYGPHGVEVILETTIIAPTSDTPKWCKKCTARMNRSTTCPLCGYNHI